ncbi:hypothetical protein [uncultured Campylobacter sp.]|uniref:hypothetical protein n=1 Tax=uncultured Campylobacter sp. TaxID=218934 RepID=UPI00260224F0|nr:hypothetical protein [uncultured Campylobacter sp.]
MRRQIAAQARIPLRIYGAGINFAFKIGLQKRELRHAVLICRRPAPPSNDIKFCHALSAQTAQRPKPNFIAAQRQNFTKLRRRLATR